MILVRSLICGIVAFAVTHITVRACFAIDRRKAERRKSEVQDEDQG